ncbi:UNVERIFIED_CONTAM: hypothetical protein RMT77_010229 [Armadillidium vulgare]
MDYSIYNMFYKSEYGFLHFGWSTKNILLFVLSFVLSFVFVVRSLLARRKEQKLFKDYGIPYVKPHILFGSFYNTDEKLRNGNDIEVFEQWIRDYGKIFGFYIGTKPNLVITDLDIVKEILIKKASNYINRPKLAIRAEPVVETLVGLRDSRWKEVRGMLSVAFTSSKIKSLVKIMNEKLDVLLSLMRNSNKNNEMDCHFLFQGLTLDIISHCAFAMNTNCMKEQNNDPFFVAVREFLKSAKNAAVMWAQYFPIIAELMTLINNYWTKSGKATRMIVDNMKVAINKRRSNLQEGKHDILQLILESSNSSKVYRNKKTGHKISPLTDKEIIANSWIFLLGGYETTASAISFTVYLLAKHPHIQEKLYNEIKNNLKSYDGCVSYECVSNLSYLDQVLNESLRLFPPVTTFLTREAQEEDKIKEYRIPKGVSIVVPIWHIHHNPKYWPDPCKFDPERFSSEAKRDKNRHSMSFIPFGAGPRNCIGMRFGITVAKIALTRILLKYRLETCEKTSDPLPLIITTVTLLPKDGIHIRAIQR